MRNGRYLAIVVTLLVSTSMLGAPLERPRDEPKIMKRIVRFIKLVIQPLGDYPSPPHP